MSSLASSRLPFVRFHPIVVIVLTFLLPLTVLAQVSRVITIADSLDGGVGGLVVDRIGNVYSADFRNTVWKIRPDGRVSAFAKGFYGSSGTALDRHGNLYQANFYGNYLSRVDRQGNHEIVVEEGLSGPVGVAMSADGTLFVNNCSANSVSRIDASFQITSFDESDLFNCPNGIIAHTDGNLYVVNFSDGNMLKVDTTGSVSLFAEIPGGGNGHITFARGNFYVTGFQSHRIFQVAPDGTVAHVAGTGTIGELDADAMEATFTFPNGIAAGPRGDRLYVNDFINRSPPTLDIPPAPKSNIRMIKLASVSDLMLAALQSGGIPSMEEEHKRFKSDPSTSRLFTETEVNVLGYQLMQRGQIEAATSVFELNVDAYPNSANAYDSLAEAYMTAGRDDEAISFYEKSLEKNSSNQNAIDMIEQIRSK